MIGQNMKKNEWQPLKPFAVYNNTKQNLGIYSKEDFKQLLHYERVRADRADSHFALVVFEVTHEKSERRDVKILIDDLRTNVRSIDHLGWFKKHVGVLLPETSRIQAMEFVRALKKRAVSAMIPFTVYSYPERSTESKGSGQNGDRETAKTTYRVESNQSVGLYDADEGRLRVSERLKSVFCVGIPLWKRCLDLAGSVLGIIALSPLFAVLFVYIKLVSPGPAFYRATRIGIKGKSFTFFKFRTMHVDNNQNFHGGRVKELIKSGGSWTKMDDYDPRIIPGGKILRKIAVDELPQLFNIFKGEMSLVGPRPCLPYEAEEFLRWHTRRFDVMPGLTGLWQVSGKDILSFEEMVRLDIAYARSMSLLMDLYLIARTPFAIVELVLRAVARKLPQPVEIEQEPRAYEA